MGMWDKSESIRIDGGEDCTCGKCRDCQIAALRAENADLAARVGELKESLDTLSLVVGLTAFKHEGQRQPLQEAYDNARKVLSLPTTGAAKRLRDEVYEEAAGISQKFTPDMAVIRSLVEKAVFGSGGDIRQAGALFEIIAQIIGATASDISTAIRARKEGK